MKLDPYKHQEKWDKWISSPKLKEVNPTNSKIIIKFLKDMALGLNVSNHSQKGARSPIRLNNLRQRLRFITIQLQEGGIKDLKKTTDKQLHKLFNDMKTGELPTKYGKPYKSTGDYIQVFKTFWHWYQKVSKKNGGGLIPDITEDLDSRGEKPKFVYFTEEQAGEIIKKASYDLKPFLALAFDSGTRPGELQNTRVSDFLNNYKEYNIRDEVAKTFGRKIKLMHCSKQIKEYIKKLDLKPDDLLCKICPRLINDELRKLGKEILKPEQIKFKNLNLMDFRHSSACYWLPRYKSESALKYRFGWKKSDMIHYYTEFLGMKDTIQEDDLYIDITKSEIEKEHQQLKRKYETVKDSLAGLVQEMKQMNARLNAVEKR